MNKSELIDAIAESTGLTKADTGKSVDALIASVTKSLQKGNKVTLPGFLTLEKVAKPARKGRNPSTGAEITIAAKNAIKIKAGKTLQDAVN